MRIGVDLGGTKIEAILLDNTGAEVSRTRRNTPQGDYAGTVNTVVELIFQLEKLTADGASIGIGTPGSISPATGLMRNCNSVCLNGKPLRWDLEQMLDRPVRIANDADCFALSEATDGSGRDAGSVFGVILGTGTGGGIVIDGKLIQGANAIAGEWGHNPLPWPDTRELPGPECYCGKYGCIETWLSGPGMVADFRRHGGKAASAAQVVSLASEGNQLAADTVQDYEHRAAKSLASIINVLDPDVIVLGGGLSNIQRLYENIPNLWEEYVFSDTIRTRLLPPVHGDSSGVRGAAWLWSV